MSMHGDVMSLAEAAGEVEPQSHGWTREEIDEQFGDDLELVHTVFDGERHNALERLHRENQRLRRLLEHYQEDHDERRA